MAGENFGRYGTAVEKIMAADHTNNSSVFELTRTYNIWQIANCPPNPPKFSLAKVLCCTVIMIMFMMVMMIMMIG